jgi:hypothetical protein
MDQTGKFVQEKNCYSNPHEAYLCIFTGLGCYLSLNSEKLASQELLFINPGSSWKTAAHTFARQVEMIAQISNYLRISHFNIHGLRKGSGTHAASGTTCPPLFTSIASRGEWSMGKILYIYIWDSFLL